MRAKSLAWADAAHRAEGALLNGNVNGALRALDETARNSRRSDDEVRALYSRLMRVGRDSTDAPAGAVARLHEHMQQAAGVGPSPATVHLEVSAEVRRGRLEGALALLAAVASGGLVAPSTGSFDLIVHAAAARRNRLLAWHAYRALRRAKLTPSAHTLNALMKAETRARRCETLARRTRGTQTLRRALSAARPQAALRLFARADAVPARGWVGSPPDGWSLVGAMAAAAAADEPESVSLFFERLLRSSSDEAEDGGNGGDVGGGGGGGGGDGPSQSVAAWNMALRARLQCGDRAGAVRCALVNALHITLNGHRNRVTPPAAIVSR